MKTVIVICLLLLSQALAQSVYTVEIKKTELWWSSLETWRIEVEAIIKLNGNPIPNSNDYVYEWWFDPDNYWERRIVGRGVNTTDSDDFLGETQH